MKMRMTYQNSSANPAVLGRSAEFTVNDGSAQSAPVTIGIRVTALPNTPVVTGATTNESEQTTSGLVISPAPSDTAAVAFFKITNITGGTLFKADGVTPISDGDFREVSLPESLRLRGSVTAQPRWGR